MEYTIKELSEKLGLKFSGNGNIVIDHVCGVDGITSGGLAYIINPAELGNLPTPKGIFDSRRKDLGGIRSPEKSAIIVPPDIDSDSHNLIFSEDPMKHHVEATELLHDPAAVSARIHKNASVGEKVTIGKGVTIDARAVVYDGVSIGDHTVIRSGVVVMEKTVIGDSCLIYPNVTIRENCRIGNRVVVHPGAVIGADGFGFFQRDEKNLKIPQVGCVVIEDDVEIGACTTIDRARFYATRIGRGSKLDNLIHIAHNVDVGEHSLIAAQSGIAGSARTGRHLIMGGQSGIKDNLKIGDNVTLLARTLITSKTDDNSTVAGMPSRPINTWRQIQALINSLDSLFERLKNVEKTLRNLVKNR
ncbi:MAG: UDP-3-O-(3-hydroxymyristoyl)glucosamine N-acyltransferase [Proteobacteria bacterium]|nr:UDP-3-O-(3-hydroxymyristoyl)glucosamine N-acyltransferase [Pseudomonadota bacterium]